MTLKSVMLGKNGEVPPGITCAVARKSFAAALNVALATPAWHSTQRADGQTRYYGRLLSAFFPNKEPSPSYWLYESGLVLECSGGFDINGFFAPALSWIAGRDGSVHSCAPVITKQFHDEEHSFLRYSDFDTVRELFKTGAVAARFKVCQQLKDLGSINYFGETSWRIDPPESNNGQLISRRLRIFLSPDKPQPPVLGVRFDWASQTRESTDSLSGVMARRHLLRESPAANLLHPMSNLQHQWESLGLRSKLQSYSYRENMLAHYLSVLALSGQCPADFLTRKCEAWYEHMSGEIFSDDPAPRHEFAELWVGNPTARFLQLAQGYAKADIHQRVLLAGAASRIEDLCSPFHSCREGSLLKDALKVADDQEAVIPWDKLQNLTLEDLAARGETVDARSNNEDIPNLRKIAQAKLGERNGSITDLCRELGSDTLWKSRPFREILLRETAGVW